MWRYEWGFMVNDLCKDTDNKKKVVDILKSVPDTDLRAPGIKTLEDAIEEIRAIGEDTIADFLAE